MRVSIRHGFTFLCMPKSASTSVEQALTNYCELITRGKYATRLKHTNYRRYHRFIEPYIKTVSPQLPETVCLMREPIDWLHSWYRYRKRDILDGSPQSTKDITFEEFCQAYMDGEINVGRQYDFIRTKDHKVGVQNIFRYEELDKLQKYFEKKIGHRIDFPVMNVSPKETRELGKTMETKLRNFLKKEYDIYNTLL